MESRSLYKLAVFPADAWAEDTVAVHRQCPDEVFMARDVHMGMRMFGGVLIACQWISDEWLLMRSSNGTDVPNTADFPEPGYFHNTDRNTLMVPSVRGTVARRAVK